MIDAESGFPEVEEVVRVDGELFREIFERWGFVEVEVAHFALVLLSALPFPLLVLLPLFSLLTFSPCLSS